MQVNALSTEQSGYDAATELLARGEQFDAIVAASDLIAIGALRALQERGIDVPGSVSVVGFDDIPAASLSSPPLTTVMQDTRRAGEALVDTLLRLVQEEHAEGVVLPTRLVVRRSCGATPAAAAPATPASRR
jgi:DNA-binding LacI/PurR family transcriptional regulator